MKNFGKVLMKHVFHCRVRTKVNGRDMAWKIVFKYLVFWQSIKNINHLPPKKRKMKKEREMVKSNKINLLLYRWEVDVDRCLFNTGKPENKRISNIYL